MVSEGGNTFFNTLIFGKRLSRVSPLLADLREKGLNEFHPAFKVGKRRSGRAWVREHSFS